MDAVIAEVVDKDNIYIVFTSWNYSTEEIFEFILKHEEDLRKEGAKTFFLENGVYGKNWDVDTSLVKKDQLINDGDELKFNHPNQRHTYNILNPEEIPLIRNIH